MDDAIAKAHAAVRARSLANANRMRAAVASPAASKAQATATAPTSRKSTGSRKANAATPRRESGVQRSSRPIAPVSSVKAPTPLRRRSMGGKSRRVPAASSEASPEERAANMAAYHAALKARGAISPRTAREAASPGREWHSSSAAQRSDDLIDVKPSLAENDDVVSTSDSDDGSEDAPAPAPAPRSARRASRDAVPSPVRRRASSSRRGRGSRSAQQQEQEQEEEEAGEEEAGRMEEDDEVEPAAAVLSEEEQEFESDTESEAGADAALADAGTDMADDEVPRVGRSSSSARRRHSARVGRGSGMSFGAAESPLRRPSHSAGQRRRSRGSGAAEHEAGDGAIGAEGEDYEEEEGEEEVGPSLWQRIAFAMLVALLALLTAFAAVGLKPDMQASPDSAPFVTAVATFLGLFVSEQEWAAALVRRLPCP